MTDSNHVLGMTIWQMRFALRERLRPKFLPLLYQMYVVHMGAFYAGQVPRRPVRKTGAL